MSIQKPVCECNTITYTSQKVETTQKSINTQMEKQNVVYPHHTMKHYLAIKKNEVLIHAITWMYFKNIMLSEGSQPGKKT